MRAYVINLPRSTARRAHIREQLAAADLPHRFIDAVDGTQLNGRDREMLVDEAAVARHPDWLTPGQIGCALSHREAYREILDDGEDVALVLEDDVVLPVYLPALLDEVREHLHGSDALLLYWRAFGRCRFSAQDAVDLDGEARLAYPMDPSQLVTSAAYLITGEACRRLVESIVPVRAGADSWAAHCREGGLGRIRCVVPRPVGVETRFKSAIDYLPPGSARQRFARVVERKRLFPFYQALALLRAGRERRMSRAEFVPERSPLAGRWTE